MENIDQPTGVESADPIDRISALLDGPDDGEPEEEREEEESQQPDDPEENAAVEGEEPEESEPEEAPEPLEEINWNGEVKKLTKTELKELAQKGFDYTQKTQQLAEQRHQFEAQAKAIQQSIALQNQQIEVIAQVKAIDGQLTQFKDVNWHQLAENDPVGYLKLNQTFRDLKEARESAVVSFQQQAQALQEMQTQAMQQTLQREAQALSESIPEFKGEKAKDTQAKIKSYLADIGFTPEEISGVTDHRTVRVAWEAAQWRALQQSKQGMSKKVAEVPKVVKSGAVKAVTNQDVKDARTQLRKTGRGEYAAKLIEKML